MLHFSRIVVICIYSIRCDETILDMLRFSGLMLLRMMKNHEKRSEKKSLASYRFEMDKVNLE